MPNYLVQRRSTGESVYAYVSDQAVEWVDYPFAEFNHIPQPEVQSQPPERVITKLQYLRRFTSEERIAIRAAAAQNPTLFDYLELLDMAQDVTLDDPDTVYAVHMLEEVGLIAPGRAVEVLA